MRKTLRNRLIVVLTVLPLLSLNSGGRVEPQSQLLKRVNDSLTVVNKKLNAEIRVILDQTRYKDSVDELRNSVLSDSTK